MRTRTLLLPLAVLLFIGNIRAEDEDDDDDERPSTTSEKRPSTTSAPAPSRADDSCGVPFNGPSRLIVGGRSADPFEWPWMVALADIDRHYPDGLSFCGGVLLTERHVLTAAHCFKGPNERDHQNVTVILGEYNLLRDQGMERYFFISDLQIHPDYSVSRSHFRNDLAILTLEKSTKFNEAIRRVCLPPHDALDYNGLNATAIGWGDTDGNKSIAVFAHVLQEVELPIMDQEECDNRYANILDTEIIPIIPATEICAAPIDGGRDTCGGDSGGPLLVRENERWTVIGIVSWGPEECGNGLPGVYTRVDGFLDWIWDQLR